MAVSVRAGRRLLVARRPTGRGHGRPRCSSLCVLAYPSYVLLFHRLASDALYAAAFALAALLTARLVEERTPGRAASVGAALALLVLIRPVSQVLVVLAPLLLVGRGSWRPRIGSLAAFVAATAGLLVLWAGHNVVRADDFTSYAVQDTGFRSSAPSSSIASSSRETGEASRELARAVQKDLLPREPYRSYGIDLDDVLLLAAARACTRTSIGLSRSDVGLGRRLRASRPCRPRGGPSPPWRLCPGSGDGTVGGSCGGRSSLEPGERAGRAERTLAPHRRTLPTPSEGQPIPSASVSAFISTPDGRFREVWTSPTEHAIVADSQRDAAHLDRLNRRVDELYTRFSDREGNASLAMWLDRASRWFPRLVVWLTVGVLAVVIRRPYRSATPVVLSTAGILGLLATSLAVPATAEYAVPFAPAFMLLAVTGVLGRR